MALLNHLSYTKKPFEKFKKAFFFQFPREAYSLNSSSSALPLPLHAATHACVDRLNESPAHTIGTRSLLSRRITAYGRLSFAKQSGYIAREVSYSHRQGTRVFFPDSEADMRLQAFVHWFSGHLRT
ncbi:hypothetical protein TSAR_007083 [Trichomalopsis sarcophagae]|uniref:Uncharacterized protein n=1 Tax=Trichomalopsis sarcophagae TaxID=543379 RepID=A0A232F5A9_9HYME|nr:hypothetical protein TSAR_007083 [Trichomalopsis sarcophagae]